MWACHTKGNGMPNREKLMSDGYAFPRPKTDGTARGVDMQCGW